MLIKLTNTHISIFKNGYCLHFYSNKAIAAIAKELKVHRSTIYREIYRNQDPQFGYHILIAEEKARKRQQDQKLRKLERRPYLKAFVIEKLQQGWSPEQIVGRMKLMGGKTITSHESIYAYIYSVEGMKTKLYQYLYSKRSRRHPKWVRKKRTLIPNRVCITQRPEFINNRSEFGHWEVDFMHFKKTYCLILYYSA